MSERLYKRVMKQKAKCWHTGSYASHDEGCFEYRFEKVDGPVYRKEDIDYDAARQKWYDTTRGYSDFKRVELIVNAALVEVGEEQT